MKLTIEHRDLFTVPEDYFLCHCISADFALGAGIAKKFAALGVRDALLKEYPVSGSPRWEPLCMLDLIFNVLRLLV